jgi:type VI protein secretion system component VasF
MDMHESRRTTGLLAVPEAPGPVSRPVRRARRRKGRVAVLEAGAVVLLCANGAMAYFGYQISLDEKSGTVEQVR